MARKKTIDISVLSKEQQDTITSQLAAAVSDEASEEAARAMASLDQYYKVKASIEKELLEKLSNSPLAERAKGNNGWTTSKILKIIANLPAKRPAKPEGFIAAARNIEIGKKTKITPAAKAKAKSKKEANAKEKARNVMFKKEESDRKKAAASTPASSGVTIVDNKNAKLRRDTGKGKV